MDLVRRHAVAQEIGSSQAACDFGFLPHVRFVYSPRVLSLQGLREQTDPAPRAGRDYPDLARIDCDRRSSLLHPPPSVLPQLLCALVLGLPGNNKPAQGIRPGFQSASLSLYPKRSTKGSDQLPEIGKNSAVLIDRGQILPVVGRSAKNWHPNVAKLPRTHTTPSPGTGQHRTARGVV